jgi:hypothetical protein
MAIMQKLAVDALLEKMRTDPDLQAKLAADPNLNPQALQAAANEPVYKADRTIYRVAVGVLGLVVVIAAIGYLVLAAQGKAVPEALVALASGAVGALAGIFAPSPAATG